MGFFSLTKQGCVNCPLRCAIFKLTKVGAPKNFILFTHPRVVTIAKWVYRVDHRCNQILHCIHLNNWKFILTLMFQLCFLLEHNLFMYKLHAMMKKAPYHIEVYHTFSVHKLHAFADLAHKDSANFLREDEFVVDDALEEFAARHPATRPCTPPHNNTWAVKWHFQSILIIKLAWVFVCGGTVGRS